MSPTSSIDITGSLKGQVSVTPEEHADERSQRLEISRRQSVIEDRKGIVVFGVLLLALVSIGLAAAYKGLFDPTATQDTQKWAQTILTAIMSGGISFVLGRKTTGKP